MGRCGDCKHWEPPDSDNRFVPNHGTCRAIRSDEDIDANDDPADLAFASAVEGNQAFLVTRAGFGCVLFEPKPD